MPYHPVEPRPYGVSYMYTEVFWQSDPTLSLSLCIYSVATGGDCYRSSYQA